MSLTKTIQKLKKFLKNQEDKINVKTIQKMVDTDSHGTPTYAKIIEATKCVQTGAILITYELFFPRCILAEKNTHRKHSKNTGSSRAIPVLRILKDIMRSPFLPLFWGANKSGMQSATELVWWKRVLCCWLWVIHRYVTYFTVRSLNSLGLHKQWANRLIEPHSYVRQVVTSSDLFDNFFDLRYHDDAQPEIILLAALMLKELNKLQRTQAWRKVDATKINSAANWHLPYITNEERIKFDRFPWFLAKLSSARTARTSYLTQEGVEPNPEKEIETFKKLALSEPIHASPLEHIAYPAKDAKQGCRNFEGFIQYRAYYEEKEFGAPIVIPKV